jgi:hypothetical protein
MAPHPPVRTTVLTAGVSALVATGLWVVSGFVNHQLLVNLDQASTPVIQLVAPSAMSFRRTIGGSGITWSTAVACVLLALVVAGITALAVFRLTPGQGRLTLLFATWFAAVAGSFVASTVQALGLASDLNRLPGSEVLNLLVPLITSGAYWGLALGWLVGVTAVITSLLSDQGTGVAVTGA